uniref:Uncharacterized protein n=1 Tax=Arundo donax TaxID=35708 RepID=A0A0A9FC01_ARUDO
MKENITMNHRLVGETTRTQESQPHRTVHNRKGRIACLVIKLHFQEQTSALTKGQLGSYSSKGKNSSIYLTPFGTLLLFALCSSGKNWMPAIRTVIWHQRFSKFDNSMLSVCSFATDTQNS